MCNSDDMLVCVPDEKRRRWPKEDNFYTFEEFLAFFNGDEELAKDVWSRSIPEEDWDQVAKEWAQEALRLDIQELPLVNRGNLTKGNFVFQNFCPEPEEFRNSLRMNANGYAELSGGAGQYATFELEPHAPLDESFGKQLVRLKNLVGGYLCLDSEQQIRFGGDPRDPGTLFEIAWYKTSVLTPITLAHYTGKLVGMFLLRFASSAQPESVEPWLECALTQAREEISSDKNSQLVGKRRHRDNPTGRYYTFEEWVEYIYYRWLGACPMAYASVLLAKELWLKECEPEDTFQVEGDEWMKVDDDVWAAAA